MATSLQVKSKQRVAAHGEVFTAEREVKAMCDLVADECSRIDSRFLEPACGNGNFLAEVLRRKLEVVKRRYGKSRHEYERYAVLALSSLYGVDILSDNAEECRIRLLNLWNEEYYNTLAAEAAECAFYARLGIRRRARHADSIPHSGIRAHRILETVPCMIFSITPMF